MDETELEAPATVEDLNDRGDEISVPRWISISISISTSRSSLDMCTVEPSARPPTLAQCVCHIRATSGCHTSYTSLDDTSVVAFPTK